MSTRVDTPTKTFKSSGALAKHLRVRLDGSIQLALCAAASTDGLGTVRDDVFAVDIPTTVILENKQGTMIYVANAAITAGVEVFAAAGGKIAPAGTVSLGEALEAATADGDEIEVYPRPQ